MTCTNQRVIGWLFNQPIDRGLVIGDVAARNNKPHKESLKE